MPLELRQSRQSLAAASDRMSRASYAGSGIHGAAHSVVSSRRARPRSRSRDQLNGAHIHSHHRPSSRYELLTHFHLFLSHWNLAVFLFSYFLHLAIFELELNFVYSFSPIFRVRVFVYGWMFRYSTAGSTHTLNNYCDTSDNWTDHDMEIYMTRNATTRNGLVPL